MTSRRRLLLESVLTVSLIVLAAANGIVYSTRIDLTENRLHTIADASRELVSGLENEVSITYYLSDRLSERYPQPQEIVDLLNEYAASSRGNVTIRVTDPMELERPDEVEALGIVPQQLQVTEEGEQRFAIVYSGIVIDYLDRRDVVPFVFSASTLEYDLTTSIRSLALDESPSLVVVLGEPDQTLDNSYRYVATELSRSFDVRDLALGDPIPDDVDVAMLVDAHLFGESDLAPIRAYLDRGGALLVTVERVEVDLRRGLSVSAVGDAPIFDFLAEHGIVVGDGMLLDESHNQIQVEEVTPQFTVTRTYPYPHWPTAREQYTSAEHPVTARFTGLDLYWPTWLEETESSRAIVASTPSAWIMNEPYDTNPQQATQLYRDAPATRGQYGLVAVSDEAAGRLAVVADSDFLLDGLLQATRSGHNIEFVQNLAQWLSADEALLEIRTRASRNLSLNAIDDPAVRSAGTVVAHVVNIALVPGAVAVYGVVRLAGRRRRSRRGGETA
ncbi:MAG: Gldg family protein [Spirochaetota bacterium]